MHEPAGLAGRGANGIDCASSGADEGTINAVPPQNLGCSIHGITFPYGANIKPQTGGKELHTIPRKQADLFVANTIAGFLFILGGDKAFSSQLRLP